MIGTSVPYNPEVAKAQKIEYCKTLLELQRKLPQNFQYYYDHVQTKLCPDDAIQQYDIAAFIKENLPRK